MRLSFIAPPELRALGWARVAAWAADNGFHSVDAEPEMTDRDVEAIRACGLDLGPMRIRASTADSSSSDRAAAVRLAEEVIDRSVDFGVRTLWHLPRNFRNDASGRENFAAALSSLESLTSYAEDRGVRLAIENCPFAGQNAVCTPEAWDALFAEIPSPALGICLDPSHCVWQGIDHLRVIRAYRDRILLAQAKDAEVLADGLFRYGVEGRKLADRSGDGADAGWWRHRLPGSGAVDWNAYISALLDIGYRGVLSIEHEDPFWSGTVDLVQQGLSRAAAHLGRFVPHGHRLEEER